MNEEFDPTKHEILGHDGFVLKEAADNVKNAEQEAGIHNKSRSLVEKALGRNKLTGIDVLHGQAIQDNKLFDAHKKVFEDRQQEDERVRRKFLEDVDALRGQAIQDNKLLDVAKKDPKDQEKEIARRGFLGGNEGREFVQVINNGFRDGIRDSKKEVTGVIEEQVKKILTVFGLINAGYEGSSGLGQLLQKLDPVKYPEVYSSALRAFTFLGHSSVDAWEHALCHCFESYGYSSAHKYSVFGLEDVGAINDVLKDFAERKGFHSFYRIVWPLIEYNINVLNSNNLNGAFPLRPEKFSSQEFISKIPSSESHNLITKLFCEAKTPREFILNSIKNDLPLISNPKMASEGGTSLHFFELIESVRHDIPADIFDAYFNKYLNLQDQNISVDQAISNIKSAENAIELDKGLFVDVDGTLVEDGKLNKSLILVMEEVSALGDKVIIFSGGDAKIQTEVLLKLGVPEKFLPVKSKVDYIGKVLGFIIDDTETDLQGFKARDFSEPTKPPAAIYLKYLAAREK